MKNKGKIFLFTIMAILTITISISTLVMNYTNKNEKVQIRYETYIVQQGDTLWGIAKKYNKQGEDIRKLIYEIREHNDITPIIHEGQVIEIPIKGERENE
ncbi:MAG: LysM peptidoglycan-binding domain-containing protein [Clostridiales bacterium]|nr:LysM peptidoglycan-binding domain-containing protein [Clostridiales bacterium]